MGPRVRRARPKTKAYDAVGVSDTLDSKINSLDRHLYKQMLLRVSKHVENALKEGEKPPTVGH